MADRMPPLTEEQMTPEQREAAAVFQAQRGMPLFGPFVPLSRSPKLLAASTQLGSYCRFHSSLPPEISELIILVTSREWSEQFEWAYHYPIALSKGVPEAAAMAIFQRKTPEGLSTKQFLAWQFCTELQQKKCVSDELYSKALETFGEAGVLDMCAISGYYTFLALTMNVARTPRPESPAPVFPPLS